jgi:hypothetical protein
VIGVPCERLGEEVKAFVVLKQGYELSADEFIDWCKEQFAANKYPRSVEFRTELRSGGPGRYLSVALREAAAEACLMTIRWATVSAVCRLGIGVQLGPGAHPGFFHHGLTDRMRRHCFARTVPSATDRRATGNFSRTALKCPACAKASSKFHTEEEIYKQIANGGNGMTPFRDH